MADAIELLREAYKKEHGAYPPTATELIQERVKQAHEEVGLPMEVAPPEAPAAAPPQPAPPGPQPVPVPEAPQEAPAPQPIKREDARAITDFAKIRTEGAKLTPQMEGYLSQMLKKQGKEVTPDSIAKQLRDIRRNAEQGRFNNEMDFEVARIDAMQQYGKTYKTRDEMRAAYSRDIAESKQRESKAPERVRGVATVSLGEREFDVPNAPDDVNLLTRTAGTVGNLGVGIEYTPEEEKMLQVSSEFAEEAGVDKVHSAYIRDGASKRKNIVVFAGELPDGTIGLDVNKYRQSFTLYHFDRLRRQKFGRVPVGQLDEADREQLRRDARAAANEDVAKIVSRHTNKGMVAVDIDPDGTTQKLMDSPGFWWAPGDETILNGIESVHAGFGQTLKRYYRIPVAMLEPITGAQPVSATTWGTDATHIQTSHPLWSFFNAGLWTGVLSWALDDRDFRPGDREHIEKLRSGYDYTQDMHVIGEILASQTPWADSETAQRILGTVGTVGLAFMEPDAFGALTTVGGLGARAAMRTGKAKVVDSVAGAAASGIENVLLKPVIDDVDLQDLYRQYPEIARIEQTETAVQIAKQLHPIKIKPGHTPRTALNNAGQVVEKAEKQAAKVEKLEGKVAEAEEAAKKASDNSEARDRFDQVMAARTKAQKEATENYESALKAHKDEMDALRKEHGDELVGADSEVTAAELAVQQARHEYDRAKVSHDYLQALPPEKLPPRKGMKVTFDGREFTYDGKVTSEGVQFARLYDGENYITVPMNKVQRAAPWTKADLEKAQQARDAIRQELAKLKADQAALLADKTQTEGRKNLLASYRGKISTRENKLEQLAELLGEQVREMPIRAVLDEFDRSTRALSDAEKMLTKAQKKRLRLIDQQKSKFDALGAKTPTTPDLPKIHARKLGKAGDKLFEAQARAFAKTRQAKTKVLEAQQKLLDAKAPVIPAAGFEQEIRRRVLTAIAADLRKLQMVVRKTGNATPSSGIAFEGSIAGAIEPGAKNILDTFHQRYGKDWGQLTDQQDIVSKIIVTEENLEEAQRMLFDLEQKILRETRFKDQMVSAPMEQFAKGFFDPGSNLRTGIMGEMVGRKNNTVALRAAEAFRWVEKIKRTFSPSYQRWGEISKEVQEVAERTANKHSARQSEIGQIVREHGLAGVIKYITTFEKFDLRDGATVANLGSMTLFDRAVAYLRHAPEDDPALLAIVRAAVPPAHYGNAANAAVMQAVKERLLKPEPLTFAELQEVVTKHTGRVYHKSDSDHVVARFITLGLLNAATQYDLFKATQQVLGPLTPQQVRGMNYLMSGGMVDASGIKIGEIHDLDLEGAYEALNRLGYSYTSDQVHRLIGETITSNRELHKWIEHSPVGAAPQPMIKYMSAMSGRFVKELEAYHKKTTGLDNTKRLFAIWLSAWRRSIVTGLVLPRFSLFTNQFFGDLFSQVPTSRGWADAGTQVVRNTPLYLDVLQVIPGVPALSKKVLGTERPGAALAGSLPKYFTDPAINAVQRGDDSVIIKTAEGPRTAAQLKQEAQADGVYDFIAGRDFEEMTARDLARHAPSWMKKFTGWGELSGQVVEDIQARTRLGQYLSDRAKGVPRAQAKQQMLEVFYDWKHTLTPLEAGYITRVFGFYTFWRNAFRQLNYALMEGVTNPGKEYWTRAAVGQTKLGRIRTQATIAMAAPEYVWWDDPNEILNDEEQLWEFRKRVTPWWLGARTMIDQRALTPEEIAWHRAQGRDVTTEALIIPALTSLDSLYLFALTQHTIAAGLQGDARSDAMENLEDELTGQLIPPMAAATDALLDIAHGRSGSGSNKGTPLMENEVALLRQLGLDGFVTRGPEDTEHGKYWMDSALHTALMGIFRAMPVLPEFQAYAGNLQNPALDSQGALSKAYLTTVFRDFSGFGKGYTQNPDKNREREVNRQNAELKSNDKSLERLSKSTQ